jgi:type I restriction enzyme S subunit
MLDSSETVELSSLCSASTSRYDPRKKPDTLFKYVEIENVDARTGSVSFQEVWGRDAPSRARKMVKSRNVIVSMVRPNRGIVGVVPEELDRSICSTGFCVLKPEKVDANFLFCLLKTSLAIKQLVHNTTASMYPTISEKDVLSVRIPRRILGTSLVDRVSELAKESAEMQRNAISKLVQAFALVEDESYPS